MGRDGEEDRRVRHRILATSQNGWVGVWKKSRGTQWIVLDGEDWCEVLHGQLNITPDGTAKEERRIQPSNAGIHN